MLGLPPLKICFNRSFIRSFLLENTFLLEFSLFSPVSDLESLSDLEISLRPLKFPPPPGKTFFHGRRKVEKTLSHRDVTAVKWQMSGNMTDDDFAFAFNL